MSKYKLVIFDLDGTLLNTIGDIHNALNYALRVNGLNQVEIADSTRFIGNGVKVLIARALDYVGVNSDENSDLYNSVMEAYKTNYSKSSNIRTAPYDGVENVLEYLKNEGVKLAVLTNKPHEDAIRIVEEYFPGVFDYVQGAQDGINIKPEPDGALKIIEKFGVLKEEVLFVGDSDVDIITARNAGVDSVGCLYGYRDKKTIHKAKASYVINKPQAILRFFEKDINGVLIVDKPFDMSSQDCLNKVKKILNCKKIGHAGTLDPLATGVLVVLLGDATKLSDYLLEEVKEYICEITVGKETTTLDEEGKVTDIVHVDYEIDPDPVLESLKGENYLVPPMYSAIKINGMKMYELARKGEEISLESRRTIIYDIERTSEIEYDDNLAIFEFRCEVSKGTYVRSLCKEIGKRLHYPAYMSKLRRIRSGNYTINDAYTLDDLKEGTYQVISMLDALKHKTVVSIGAKNFSKSKDGKPIFLDKHTEEIVFLEYKGRLIAIYELVDPVKSCYKAKRVWKQ